MSDAAFATLLAKAQATKAEVDALMLPTVMDEIISDHVSQIATTASAVSCATIMFESVDALKERLRGNTKLRGVVIALPLQETIDTWQFSALNRVAEIPGAVGVVIGALYACQHMLFSGSFVVLSTSRECKICKKTDETTLKKCARCKNPLVQYCSRECQRQDWPTHRLSCVQISSDIQTPQPPPNSS